MLIEATLKNAQLQLIVLAERLHKYEGNLGISISKYSNNSLLDFIRQFTDLYANVDAVPQPSDNADTVRRKATNLVHGARQLLENHEALFTYIAGMTNRPSIILDMLSSGESCIHNLDEAVMEISNLTFSPNTAEKTYTKADIEHVVAQ